jgi:hypothetical protein
MAFSLFVWTMIPLWGVCEILSRKNYIGRYWPTLVAAVAQIGIAGWACVYGFLPLAGLAALLCVACSKVTWDKWNERN